MYHPPDPTELTNPPSDNSDDYEFIELKNISTTQTIDLAGVEFDDGIEYAFPDNQPKLLGRRGVFPRGEKRRRIRSGATAQGLNVVGPYTVAD